ncbi:MAG TPA: thioredoxin domain-containing protein [Acidimicrobiia bacterium]|nr:thioredoxin domain-containing protein [Acidimicrobiia bacterium]
MIRPDLAAVHSPNIVAVWAPACVECQAMQPVVQAVAEFSGRVQMLMVNAAEEIKTARASR